MNSTDRGFSDYVTDGSQPDGIRPIPDTGDAPAGPADGPLVVDLADRTSTQPVGPAPAPEATETPAPAPRAPRITRASAAWAAITAALLLALILIVFVLQNPTVVVLHFLGFTVSVAVGMAMLIAAVTGGLLVAAIGVARLTQLRVGARRARRQPAKP